MTMLWICKLVFLLINDYRKVVRPAALFGFGEGGTDQKTGGGAGGGGAKGAEILFGRDEEEQYEDVWRHS